VRVHQTGNGIECPVNMSRGPRRGETPEKEGRVEVIEIRLESISRGREDGNTGSEYKGRYICSRTRLTEDGRSGARFEGRSGHMDVIPVRQRMKFKKP